MPLPCDVLMHLTTHGGNLIEKGVRKYDAWEKQMRSDIHPSLSDAVLQRVWSRAKADLAQQHPGFRKAMVGQNFADNLAGRIGRENAANFIETLDDLHPAIFDKLTANGAKGPLTPNEQTALTSIWYQHTRHGATTSRITPAGMAEITAALRAHSDAVREQLRIKNAPARALEAQKQKDARIAARQALLDARTPDKIIQDEVSRRLGKDGAASLMDTLRTGHPDIFDKFTTGKPLDETERATLATVFEASRKPNSPTAAQTPSVAMQEIAKSLADARREARRLRNESLAPSRQLAREQKVQDARDQRATEKANRTPEEVLRDDIAGRIGKDNATKFLDTLKANHGGIFDKIMKGDPLEESERDTVATLYEANRKARGQGQAQSKTDALKAIMDSVGEAGRETAQQLRNAGAPARAEAGVDRRLEDMTNYFPDKPKKADILPIAVREYVKASGNLTRFAAGMKKHFGDTVSEATLRKVFQQAAQDFKAQNKPVEDIKAQMVRAIKDEVLASRSPGKKVLDTINDTLSLPTSLITSVDYSAPFRQGGKLTFANPRMAVFNRESPFVKMLQASGRNGERIADAVHADIETRPNANNYKVAKLHFTEYGQRKIDLSKGEELFRSNLAMKVPWVRVSERAYVTYMNKLRADCFDMFHAQLSKGGKEVTGKEMEAIGNFINVTTGRGGGERLASFSHAANGILFSPRNMVSQFQYAAGQPLYGGNTRTRALIAGQYVQYAVAVSALFALAKAGGADIDFDPHSQDFLKIRLGNVVIDPLGGVQQPVVLATQLSTGQKERQSGYKGSDGGERDMAPSETLTKFARNKMSPVFGSIADFFSRYEQDQGFTPEQKSPRLPDGSLKTPYGKDFLGRDVSTVGGLGTDIATVIDKSKGGDGSGVIKNENTRLLRAMDYYFTKNAVPITLTDLSNAFAQNGTSPAELPKSLLPVTAGIFGMNARVMDQAEIERRAGDDKSSLKRELQDDVVAKRLQEDPNITPEIQAKMRQRAAARMGKATAPVLKKRVNDYPSPPGSGSALLKLLQGK